MMRNLWLVLGAALAVSVPAFAETNEKKETAFAEERLAKISENRTEDKITDLDRRVVQLERDVRDIRDSVRYLDRDVDDLQRKVR